VVVDLPLGSIIPDHVLRDRMVVDAPEMAELKSSIRAHGLRLPIEVVPLADGRFGLISGWRRVTALQQLQDEAGGIATVKAFVRALHTAMVEENELRAKLTPCERGRIAVMAAHEGAFGDTEAAIDAIFAAASRAKRSKIRSFTCAHEELGDMLHFPTDLSERNGLRLAYALREGAAPQLRAALRGSRQSGPACEWAWPEPVVAASEAIERGCDENAVNRGGAAENPVRPTHGAAGGFGQRHLDGAGAARGRLFDPAARQQGRCRDGRSVDGRLAPPVEPAGDVG
jgi:ParB family chromosome partitioning protein